MNRLVWFIICTVVGLELIGWALLAPVHIRAIDAQVLELAGASGPSLADEGLSLVNLEKTGPARLLLEAIDRVGASGGQALATALERFENGQPKLKVWGGAALYLERIFERNPPMKTLQSVPIIDLLVTQNARESIVNALQLSRRPGVLEIIRTRQLTNTTIFPAATSASGQPLDSTIAATALLFQQDSFAAPLRDSIEALVVSANRGGPIQPLETVYLDLLALGKRLNFIQLVTLLRDVPDTNALQQTAQLLRDHDSQLPIVFAAIYVMESPRPVAKYLAGFPASGLRDLTMALRAGTAAVHDLLDRQQPVYYPTWRQKLVTLAPVRLVYEPLARISASQPFFGYIIKYGLYLVGVLLIARAVTYLSPSLTNEIVESRSFLTGPQVVIGLCLLFGILFFTESLVARPAPKVEFPMRIRFPMASAALRATIPHHVKDMIDKLSALSLLIFFVMQAVIYVFCRMKLAEIRRQTLPSRLKLRLLENEENLFDAGLYFGFVGTVLSLIMVSIGVVKFSLMAAYSSTSFGIIFVSILKIFHVRPYRRRLIMDSEVAEREVQPA